MRNSPNGGRIMHRTLSAPTGPVPFTWGTPPAMVDRRVVEDMIRLLHDLEYNALLPEGQRVPLETFASRYLDEHKKFVSERFQNWKLPRMLLRIDLPSEGIPLDRVVIHNALLALEDDLRPGN